MSTTDSPDGTAVPSLADPGTAGVRKVRVHHLAQAKARGERLTMLTAYETLSTEQL